MNSAFMQGNVVSEMFKRRFIFHSHLRNKVPVNAYSRLAKFDPPDLASLLLL